MNNVTHLLNAIDRGDPVAGDELLPLVYEDFFVGLSMPEAAEAVGIPLRKAERLWAFSKSWLRQTLGDH